VAFTDAAAVLHMTRRMVPGELTISCIRVTSALFAA
jgi:hypothetical protein